MFLTIIPVQVPFELKKSDSGSSITVTLEIIFLIRSFTSAVAQNIIFLSWALLTSVYTFKVALLVRVEAKLAV